MQIAINSNTSVRMSDALACDIWLLEFNCAFCSCGSLINGELWTANTSLFRPLFSPNILQTENSFEKLINGSLATSLIWQLAFEF